MKRVSRFNNLQFIIAISSIMLAIIPMSYTAYSLYTKYANELINNSQVFSSQIMDQLGFNLDEYLSSTIKTNEEVDRFLIENNQQLDTEFRTKINSFVASRNDIVSIGIFDAKGAYLFSQPGVEALSSFGIEKEPWFDRMMEGNILYFISEPHVQKEYNNDLGWVISVAKQVRISNGVTLQKGILKVDISIKQLNELCNTLNLGGSGYVFITNGDDKIIYHPQQALIYAGLKKEVEPGSIGEAGLIKNSQNNEVLRVTKAMSFVDWKLVGITHIEAVAEKNSRILREIFVAIPVIMLAIILISWFISGMITSPIKELESKMKRVQKGDFDALINLTYGEKEVVELANSYNIMVTKIKNLIEEKRLEHEAKRQSELNALQAQINPHFLYNTLDSIMWMAESGQNDEVVEMVTALARLFRISISKGKRTILVKQELEHAKNYLLIQKRRYKEKFTFVIEASEEVKELETLKLILQPIIENAIYHGIEYMVDEGEILIKVYVKDECLIYEVIDNGLGMDEDTRMALLNNIEEVVPTSGGSGVGVHNVDERIKLSYGPAYGLEIESKIEEGTTVRIILPIMGGETNEA